MQFSQSVLTPEVIDESTQTLNETTDKLKSKSSQVNRSHDVTEIQSIPGLQKIRREFNKNLVASTGESGKPQSLIDENSS